MEMNVKSETDTKILCEIEEVDHTLLNLLKEELYKVKGVTATSYSIEHPLIKKANFYVETDGKIKPRDAVKEAITSIKKEIKDFLTAFSKIKK